MHDRWRCHKNMNWNLLAPLQFVDTHLLWSIMRIYLHSVTTYNQPLQDSSSNPMLFRFFFLRIHGKVLTMNFFKFGSLGQQALENPCLPSGESTTNPRATLGGESSKEPENGGSEDANVGRFWRFWFGIWKTWSFTNKSPGTRCSVEKMAFRGCFWWQWYAMWEIFVGSFDICLYVCCR